jgi:hypothetical protein
VIVNEFFLSGVLRFLDLSRRQFQHLPSSFNRDGSYNQNLPAQPKQTEIRFQRSPFLLPVWLDVERGGFNLAAVRKRAQAMLLEQTVLKNVETSSDFCA